MDKFIILDALQAAHDSYFSLLLKNYPLFQKDAPFADFGPPEFCELAVEVHSCAIALGPKARERLFYLGLDLLYPFDNPVDLYNWRVRVKEENIDHTTYASIAIRIDSELKRMRRVLEFGGEGAYDALPDDAFLVSKNRYKSATPPDKGGRDNNQFGPTASPQNMHIDTVNIQYAADSQAVSKLETLERETTIGANVSSIIGALRALFVG